MWMLSVKRKVICIHVLRGYVIIFVCVAEQLGYSNVFIYVFVVCHTSAQQNGGLLLFHERRDECPLSNERKGGESQEASGRRISSQMLSYTISVSTTANVIHFFIFLHSKKAVSTLPRSLNGRETFVKK